jgi:hypothetical protein
MGVGYSSSVSAGQYKFYANSGTAALPSYTFATQPNIGFYAAATNELGYSSGGTACFRFWNIYFKGMNAAAAALMNEASSATNPTLIPNVVDFTTGLASEGAGILNLITAATTKAKVTADGAILLTGIPTATAPAYVEGGIYYDTTLHKLRVGGAAGWETITSV